MLNIFSDGKVCVLGKFSYCFSHILRPPGTFFVPLPTHTPAISVCVCVRKKKHFYKQKGYAIKKKLFWNICDLRELFLFVCFFPLLHLLFLFNVLKWIKYITFKIIKQKINYSITDICRVKEITKMGESLAECFIIFQWHIVQTQFTSSLFSPSF